MEYLIPPKHSLKILCKCKHFPLSYRRKREWVFFLNTFSEHNVVQSLCIRCDRWRWSSQKSWL